MLARNIRKETQVTVPASGTVTALFTVPFGPSWEVKQIGIKCDSTTETICNTYIGTNSAGVFISKSFTGNDDTDSQPNITLRSGDSICAVWESGSLNAIARLTVIYDEVDY